MTDVSTRPAARPIGHRPRIRVNHVPTFQVADQNAIKIIQVVMKDDGNPRPFCIVGKNLSTSMIATFLPVS
jgi:hypothetical protein